MTQRRVSVDFSGSFEFDIDDEAVSEWDGAKILEVLEKRGKGKASTGDVVYSEEATLKMLLGELGWALSVDGRSMGSFDGWADFPAGSARGNPYEVYYTFERVLLDGIRVTS